MGTAGALLLPVQRTAATTAAYLDPMRIAWYDRFFTAFSFDSAEELLAAVGEMRFGLETMERNHDLRLRGLGGWLYWVLFIRGYLQYAETGAVAAGNAYYDYLVGYFVRHEHDPGLRPVLTDPAAAMARVMRRFQDFDFFRKRVSQLPGAADLLPPVRIVVRGTAANTGLLVHVSGRETPVHASSIDGYHRMFLARLFKIPQLPCEIVEVADDAGPEGGLGEPDVAIAAVAPAMPPAGQLWGAHLDLPLAGGQVEVGAIEFAGWVLGKEAPAIAVEIVRDGAVVRYVPLNERRPDVAAAFPHVPDAERGGFRATVNLLGMTGAEEEVALLVRAVLHNRARVPLAVVAMAPRAHQPRPRQVEQSAGNPSDPIVPKALVPRLERRAVDEPAPGRGNQQGNLDRPTTPSPAPQASILWHDESQVASSAGE